MDMDNLNYETVTRYLRQCLNKIHKEFNDELKKYQMTSTHLGVMLLLLNSESGYSMTELSREMKVDNALMTRNIKELEKIEYIYRDRQNDKTRKYHICLTDRGKKVALELETIMKKKQKKFKESFTLEEQNVINEAISIVAQKFINQMKEE